jgi:hypothetical protein
VGWDPEPRGYSGKPQIEFNLTKILLDDTNEPIHSPIHSYNARSNVRGTQTNGFYVTSVQYAPVVAYIAMLSCLGRNSEAQDRVVRSSPEQLCPT